jgi:hypothetical protein
LNPDTDPDPAFQVNQFVSVVPATVIHQLDALKKINRSAEL